MPDGRVDYRRREASRVPKPTRDQVDAAMALFDQDHRATEPNAGRKFAVEAPNGKRYPPKRLLELSSGISRRTFGGGPETNDVFKDLGYAIVEIAPGSADFLTRAEIEKQHSRVHDQIGSLDDLSSRLFAQPWQELRNVADHGFRALDGALLPGVYLVAFSERDLQGEPARESEVYYIGMSHAGISKRLNQFIRGLKNGHGHCGAVRHFQKHGPYDNANNDPRRFFVTSVPVPARVVKGERTPDDLRRLGIAAALEWYALARVKEKTGKEPCLNSGVGARREGLSVLS